MSLIVWVMVGMAVWYFTVLAPDKLVGGIIGAFLATVAGALLTGYALPRPGIPGDNPPGVGEALWAVPGSLLALALCYVIGARSQRPEWLPIQRSTLAV